jgi:hypothetical protein
MSSHLIQYYQTAALNVPAPLSIQQAVIQPNPDDLLPSLAMHSEVKEVPALARVPNTPQSSEENQSLQQLFREWGVVANESPFDHKAATLISEAHEAAEGRGILSGSSGSGPHSRHGGPYPPEESNPVVTKATNKPANKVNLARDDASDSCT